MKWLGKILCLAGLHNWQQITNKGKHQCSRCKYTFEGL